jgi:hypothetical protein
MKGIIAAIVGVIMVIGMMPFLYPATKIEWITYTGMPLIISMTGMGMVAQISHRGILCY